jgi:mRNA interferase HigB
MRVISNKALVDFSITYTDATEALQVWRKLIEGQSYPNYAALKATFNATDKVQDYYVFDIGGNKYRIVSAIHFNHQTLYIRHVFTHKEYDKWKP